MIALLVLIIFGIGVAVFATQNTQGATITLAQYTLTKVPMYLIVLCALLLGIFISWIISLVGFISSSLTIHVKDTKIKEAIKEIAELTKQVHQLELENERLKAEQDVTSVDDKSL